MRFTSSVLVLANSLGVLGFFAPLCARPSERALVGHYTSTRLNVGGKIFGEEEPTPPPQVKSESEILCVCVCFRSRWHVLRVGETGEPWVLLCVSTNCNPVRVMCGGYCLRVDHAQTPSSTRQGPRGRLCISFMYDRRNGSWRKGTHENALQQEPLALLP